MHHFDNFPPNPLTLEGSAILHQMLKVRWREWRALPSVRREEILSAAAPALTATESNKSGLFSLLGHKGDLMLIHFRDHLDGLEQVERDLQKLALWDYLELSHSYLSVVELGLYESTMKVYATLAERLLEPHSEEWEKEIQETLQRQRTAMHPRLFPEIPPQPYVCFYPMDRLRGEHKNWYLVPIAERQRMMADHGEIGRRYAGKVKQIISGSIGLDDWEWGVDLFAEDPTVFKQLIYEMRFDEVSAVYAKFGSFFVGKRTAMSGIGTLLAV
jgi:peroxiredoxin